MTRPQPIRLSRHTAATACWRDLDGAHVVSSAYGNWTWLSSAELRQWLEGKVAPDSGLHQRLTSGNLLRTELNAPALIEQMRERRSFLRTGPSHHWIALTRRAQKPSPIWTSPDEPGTDMPVETLERVLDTAFMTTNPLIEITLGGGEPFLAPELIQHAIAYARRKNAISRKAMTLVVETPLHRPEKSWADLAINEQILIRTSPAGHRPAAVEGSGAIPWAKDVQTRLLEQGADLRDAGIEVTVMPDAADVAQGEALLIPWLDAGIRAFHVQPLRALDDHLHVVAPTAPTANEHAAFHAAVIDRLARGAENAFERSAATLLSRIRRGHEPRRPILRNPSASGTGTLAYGCDGEVYTCRDGFLSGLLGEGGFEIGSVHQDGYHDLVGHPTVRAMLMATSLEGQPGWSNHPYMQLCGMDPVENFWRQGSLHGRMIDAPQAIIQIAVLDHLFTQSRLVDSALEAAFNAWSERP